MLVIWVMVTSASIFLFAAQSIKEFDPKLYLASHLMTEDFEKRLVDALPNTSSSHIYHILKQGCGCALINSIHRNTLNTWAKEQSIKQATLMLQEYPELSALVPSIPAVIVIDNKGELVYFGPYSQGSGCFASDGFVDSVIERFVSQQARGSINQAIIRSEGMGCYCQNEQATPYLI